MEHKQETVDETLRVTLGVCFFAFLKDAPDFVVMPLRTPP
ncbi:MAG: hypothetical protein JWQ02_4341 [Capsulimonas sp.]|nr:hypothetical protein [Capsulimonas sp.]